MRLGFSENIVLPPKSGTIDSAKAAAARLNQITIQAGVIHSAIPKAQREKIMKDFSSGKVKVIIGPKILDEGIDVPEADLAIIIASSKTKIQMIQRMGRVLRLKKNNRFAKFVVLYIKDTSEDPEKGAHEDFLNELTDVAESINILPSSQLP